MISSTWSLSSLTGEWEAGPSLSEGRYDHCTLTYSNMAVVTGGYSGSLTLSSVEGVSGESVSQLPHLLTARRSHGCTVTQGGMLVAGGLGQDGTVLTSVEMYVSGVWKEVESLPSPRYNFPMVSINNSPLVLGGINAENVLVLNTGWQIYCTEGDDLCHGVTRSGHTALDASTFC